MTQPKNNYDSMSDLELKRYFLDHREDQAAFYAYMDRRHARPNRQIISPDDPEWQQKVIASIKRQMGEKVDNGNQSQP